MNERLDAPAPMAATTEAPPAPMSPWRRLAWSVRRELWENRSIVVAPLAVGSVVLFACLVSTLRLPAQLRAVPEAVNFASPYKMAPAPIMLVTILVAAFYCLDALYGERRDRSILFWKSLPVSDLTTVIAKASIPLLVLPVFGVLLSAVAQLAMLLAGSAVLLASGLSPAKLWAEMRFFEGLLIMPYGLGAHALWFAPIYGWLLLVSAWARRMPVVWAVLPPFTIAVVERIAGGTTFLEFLKVRLGGAMTQAFAVAAGGEPGHVDGLAQLTPVRFLSTPGLWLGLAFAAVCLAAAVRLRRYREPI